MAALTETVARRRWRRAVVALLSTLGVLYLFGATNDLLAGSRGGLPVDHEGTFHRLAGTGYATFAASSPGPAAYVTLVERGYALHELTFALLFLVLVLIPFRRRQMWAWWTAWIPLIADVGYTMTFGAEDPTIFARSLVADIGLPLLLLAALPLFLPGVDRRRSGEGRCAKV